MDYDVTIISTGPGGKGWLTPQARDAASQCDILIGTKHQLSLIDTTGIATVYEEAVIDEIMSIIERHCGRSTGVLVTGDAGIYSLFDRVRRRFGPDAIKRVIPGVSSIQAAFAAIRESWVGVNVLSFHGRPIEEVHRAFEYDKTAILCDRNNNCVTVLTALAEAGLFDKAGRVYLCQDLTYPHERITELTCYDDIKGLEVCKRELIILLRTVSTV